MHNPSLGLGKASHTLFPSYPFKYSKISTHNSIDHKLPILSPLALNKLRQTIMYSLDVTAIP